MVTAAELVRTARRRRRLTMTELARLSGVPISTVSRAENGQSEPSFNTVSALLRAMGYRANEDLIDDAGDESIARAILSEPSRGEMYDVYRVAAQVAPVAGRRGAQAVTADLGEMIDTLVNAGVEYGISALEGVYGGWSTSGTQSLWPVVYVDPTFPLPWPRQPIPGKKNTVFVLPLTEHAREFVEVNGDVQMMSESWSIIDTIASPGRQADAGRELLEAITTAKQREALAHV